MDSNRSMTSGMNTSQSVVAACDVTMCSFNQQHQCHAGSIQVAFIEGMAHCATYTPREGAIGIGSSDVSQGMDRVRQAGSDDHAIGA